MRHRPMQHVQGYTGSHWTPPSGNYSLRIALAAARATANKTMMYYLYAEAKMAIGTSGGGWRQGASAFDGGDGRRWTFVFDGGDRKAVSSVAIGGGGRCRRCRFVLNSGVVN